MYPTPKPCAAGVGHERLLPAGTGAFNGADRRDWCAGLQNANTVIIGHLVVSIFRLHCPPFFLPQSMVDGYVESREFLPQITSRNDHDNTDCLVSRIDDIMSTEFTLQSWAIESSILLPWRQPFLSLYDYEPQRTKKMYQGFGRPVSHPSGLTLRPAGPSRGSLRENQPARGVRPVGNCYFI